MKLAIVPRANGGVLLVLQGRSGPQTREIDMSGMSGTYVQHVDDETMTGRITEGELNDLTVMVQWIGLPVPQSERTANLMPIF
jgi:hypothetical protein